GLHVHSPYFAPDSGAAGINNSTPHTGQYLASEESTTSNAVWLEGPPRYHIQKIPFSGPTLRDSQFLIEIAYGYFRVLRLRTARYACWTKKNKVSMQSRNSAGPNHATLSLGRCGIRINATITINSMSVMLPH